MQTVQSATEGVSALDVKATGPLPASDGAPSGALKRRLVIAAEATGAVMDAGVEGFQPFSSWYTAAPQPPQADAGTTQTCHSDVQVTLVKPEPPVLNSSP